MKLRLGQTGLDYDKDYGPYLQVGWTAVYRGSYLYPHLTSFWRAVWVLLWAPWRYRE